MRIFLKTNQPLGDPACYKLALNVKARKTASPKQRTRRITKEPSTMNLPAEQFEKLLTVIGTQRRGSFATCKVFFSGTRDTETVETFLASAAVFKSVEDISDEDAIKSVPLILKEEAATWWNGVKNQVVTWSDFEARIRHAFAPKRPAYQLYQNIVCIKQEEDELTGVRG